MELIFVFSLPRSGSTLLQRILASHPSVATHAEPWILLPLLNVAREGEVFADYNHRTAVTAISEFVDGTPEGAGAMDEVIRELADRLYSAHCRAGERFFLDKTPRYAAYAPDIMRIFAEARAVVLWRNPIHVIDSICRTFWGGRWHMSAHEVDLFDGVRGLTRVSQEHRDRVLPVRYEDLVDRPETVIGAISHHLGIDLELPDDVGARTFGGSLGDPGRRRTSRTLERRTRADLAASSVLRNRWVRRYLDWIGPECLADMGYDLDALRGELRNANHPLRSLPQDVIDFAVDSVRSRLRARVLHKSRAWQR